MKNIVLYGMRGVGKTTVGKLLAKNIGVKFYDLDTVIEEDIGGPIFDFVETNGWPAFRKKEHENLVKLLELEEKKVISLGGGTIVFENNQKPLLKKSDKLIYIECPLEIIYTRIKTDEEIGNKRNSLTGKDLLEELKEVSEARKDIYQGFYDFKVQNIDTEANCMYNILEKLDYGNICVPITNFNKADLDRQIDKINQAREINTVELRIDYASDKQIPSILSLSKSIKKKIMITNRSHLEGGEFKGNHEESIERIKKFSHIANYIDIELIGKEQIKSLEKKSKNQRIILSYHNFQETPSLEVLMNKITQMHISNADIFKIAVMANSKEDMETLYELQNYFKNNYPDKESIFISMGEIGQETRIKMPQKGSKLTFGTLEDSSAPGQINYEKLYKLIYHSN